MCLKKVICKCIILYHFTESILYFATAFSIKPTNAINVAT